MARQKRPQQEDRREVPTSAVLLTTKQASGIAGLSEAWFARKRWERRGPPYLRIQRSIRYVEAELLQWLSKHRVESPDF